MSMVVVETNPNKSMTPTMKPVPTPMGACSGQLCGHHARPVGGKPEFLFFDQAGGWAQNLMLTYNVAVLQI